MVLVIVCLCLFFCVLDYQGAATKDYGYEERIGIILSTLTSQSTILFCRD